MGRPQSEGLTACGSVDPHPLSKRTRISDSPLEAVRGTGVTEISAVNSKIVATPVDQIAFILAQILSFWKYRNAKEMCSSSTYWEDLL